MTENKPKALYYEMLSFRPENIELLEEKFDLTRLETPEDHTEEILEEVEVVFATLKYHMSEEMIDRMPNLKVIASNRTGEPHIDRGYAEDNGISVYTLKGDVKFLKTITPTAEHHWGILLAAMRHIRQAHEHVKDGKWDQRQFPGDGMLSNMSMGIVGLGRLGKIVAKQARAFNMEEINFYDPYVDAEEAPFANKVEDLEELVSSNDIISIHARVTEETHKMFDEELFSKFKEGSYLVNTARGHLIDEQALVDCLESGRLAGAAMDVFHGMSEINHEELLKESPIYNYIQENENLVITPHIAGCTYDAWEDTERRVINKAINHYDPDWKVKRYE